MQRIVRGYDEQLSTYANRMDHLEEMDIFLERDKTEPGRNRKYEHTKHKAWNWISNFKTLNKRKSKTRRLHRRVLPNTLEQS